MVLFQHKEHIRRHSTDYASPEDEEEEEEEEAEETPGIYPRSNLNDAPVS